MFSKDAGDVAFRALRVICERKVICLSALKPSVRELTLCAAGQQNSPKIFQANNTRTLRARSVTPPLRADPFDIHRKRSKKFTRAVCMLRSPTGDDLRRR